MSHYRKQFLYLLGLALLLGCAAPLRAADADLILKNGRIWTGDPANPWAEAVAIRGSRIVAVGNNLPVAEHAGPNSRVVDLNGRLAVPGFDDAYVHFLEGSLTLGRLNLAGACSVAEIQKRVKDWAADHPKDAWITGGGWQSGCFADRPPPARQDLDAAVRDRPVVLRASDQPWIWVNSKALQIAGIVARVHPGGPPEQAGVLKEGARSQVERAIPELSRERKLAALEQGLKLAASLGITSIGNAGGDAETLSLFDDLERQHKLTLRVNVALSVWPQMQDDSIDRLLELKQTYHSLRLRAGGVRLVLDGAIETHSAAMLAPYSDGGGAAGRLAWTPEAFNAMVTLCDSGGFEIYTQAAGDRAVRMALDAYEEARRANGPHEVRFRIANIEAVSPADLARFGRLGVVPVGAAPRLGAVAETLERAAGPERLKLLFPWQALEQAGAKLAFSSGWPAASLDPVHGIYAAVTRQGMDGKPPGGWVPVQRIEVEDAVRAYTVNGAGVFADRVKGRLKPGMLADIAVLSQDIFSISPADIAKTRVDLTIFDGQMVYSRQ